MDATKGEQNICDWKLAKLTSLYHICGPSTNKIWGYSLIHIVLVLGLAVPLLVVSVICLINLYYLTNDSSAFVFHLNGFFVFSYCSYTTTMIVRYSNEIRKLHKITSFSFMSYKHYDRKIFQYWQMRFKRVSYLLAMIIIIIFISWFTSPFVFRNKSIQIANLDGSYSQYRFNICNFNWLVSDVTYNKYFIGFFFIELIVMIQSCIFSIIFDLHNLSMCFSICCHLDAINVAIEKNGNQKCLRKSIQSTYNLYILRKHHSKHFCTLVLDGDISDAFLF